jgi:spermidine/putrescine-binding protein
MQKVVVAAALGECVHVAGVVNFLRLAEIAGWRTVFLGPAVAVTEILRVAREEKAELVGVSYRLTPETGERLLAEFAEAAKIAEEKAKKYTPDIIEIRGFEANVLKEKGVFMRYRPLDDKFILPEFKDVDGYYTGLFFATRVIAFNTKLVPPKDIPQSYEDLLNPKWNGKLGMDGRD